MVATLDVVDTLTEPFHPVAEAPQGQGETLIAKTIGQLTGEQRETIDKLLGEGKLTQAEIGTQVGCTNQVVSLVKYDVDEPVGVQSLTNPLIASEMESDAIRVLRQIYNRITATSSKEDLRAYGSTFSEFFKVARLLAGESTQNIATKNLSALIVRVDNKIKARAAKKNKGKGGGGRGVESGGERSGE